MKHDGHTHDNDGKCCECGDARHCCCDCPVFREAGADADVTKGRAWETVYPETIGTTEE